MGNKSTGKKLITFSPRVKALLRRKFRSDLKKFKSDWAEQAFSFSFYDRCYSDLYAERHRATSISWDLKGASFTLAAVFFIVGGYAMIPAVALVAWQGGEVIRAMVAATRIAESQEKEEKIQAVDYRGKEAVACDDWAVAASMFRRARARHKALRNTLKKRGKKQQSATP